jgi:tryptophan synthase alpha chain
MSRLDATFERLRHERRCGLVTYVTAGDPSLDVSADILRALDKAGADVLEVGVPFSDPLADGPVIQRASERALAAGGSLRATLSLVELVRNDVTAPIVIFSYANPIVRYGVSRFARAAGEAGVDGVLILDLPIEEAGETRDLLQGEGIDMVFLLSPTTTDERIARAGALGSGFLYGISRLGVTGARDEVAPGAEPMVRRIRRQTSLPVALGFGVSTPAHVAQIGQYADAVVVGSALVSLIASESGSDRLVDRVTHYVQSLRGACVPAGA